MTSTVPELVDQDDAAAARAIAVATPVDLSDLIALAPDDVVPAAIACWRRGTQEAWRFAFLLHRIRQEKLYGHYANAEAWARGELGKGGSVVSKWGTGGAFVAELPVEDREEVMAATHPAVIAEAGIHRLAKTDRPEAIRLAKSGKTQRELKQAVRARQASTHHYSTESLKTFSRVVDETAYTLLCGMWNLAKFFCQTPHPQPTEIATLLATEFFAGVAYADELERRFPKRDVLAGRVFCIECGASNGNGLEAHHVILRSHGGHEGPCVWLCQLHHQQVTESWEGTWRERLDQWMARVDLPWLRPAVLEFLDGRSLEAM